MSCFIAGLISCLSAINVNWCIELRGALTNTQKSGVNNDECKYSYPMRIYAWLFY